MHSRLEQIASLINRPAQTPKGEPVMVFDWSSISAKKQSEFVSWMFGDTEGSAGFAAWIRRLPNLNYEWISTSVIPFGLFGVAPSTKRWRFQGGHNGPECTKLLLLEAPTGAVLGISVKGTTVATRRSHRVASSLRTLGLRSPPKGVVAVDHAGVRKALLRLHLEVHTVWHHTHFKHRREAEAAKEKSKRLLMALRTTIDREPAFKSHPSISRLPDRYRRALHACSSTTQLSEFTARAAQFFERAMAAASWDSWMSSKKPV